MSQMPGEIKSIPQRVLIVEDEPRQQAMLTRAVREIGFESDVAGSAETALKTLGLQRFGLLLVDLNLPGMSGLDLMERVHQDWPNLRAVVLTGFGDLEAAQRAIRLDVVDFLQKPCPLEQLEQALGRAWRKRLLAANPATPSPTPMADEALPDSHDPVRIDEAERQLIHAALDRHEGNRTAAARELGISVRTLYYRLARYAAEERVSGTLSDPR